MGVRGWVGSVVVRAPCSTTHRTIRHRSGLLYRVRCTCAAQPPMSGWLGVRVRQEHGLAGAADRVALLGEGSMAGAESPGWADPLDLWWSAAPLYLSRGGVRTTRRRRAHLGRAAHPAKWDGCGPRGGRHEGTRRALRRSAHGHRGGTCMWAARHTCVCSSQDKATQITRPFRRSQLLASVSLKALENTGASQGWWRLRP